MVRRELHIIGLNRAYYAIFHAIHALDGNGYKSHKDITANFDKQYIKTEIFPRKIGRKISKAEEISHASDYDDFYIASKSEADNLISIANEFIKTVCKRKLMNILIIEDDAPSVRIKAAVRKCTVSGHGTDRISSRGRGHSANGAGSDSA